MNRQSPREQRSILIVALVFISITMKLAFNSLSFPKLFFYNFFLYKSHVVTYICLKIKGTLWLELECRIIYSVFGNLCRKKHVCFNTSRSRQHGVRQGQLSTVLEKKEKKPLLFLASYCINFSVIYATFGRVWDKSNLFAALPLF